ncbi:MAG: D-2-hydroxyacid dehydrogenase [Bacteroidota bacterium]|nr:D-2-hydroxyacid dehydrogenase [Bacteroidota bacterium]
MNIVVLDGYTLNPGDLNWAELQSLGRCTIHDRTQSDKIIERAHNAQILLTNKTVLTREILEQLPQLKYIGVLATGYNVVDIVAAKTLGVIVTNVPTYSTMSVAQLVFALLFELTHHVGNHSDEVKKGRWSSHNDFSFWDFPLVELAEKKFGIIGYGNIGKAVAAIAVALGMEILVSTRTPENYKTFQASKTWQVSFVDTDTLFKTSDVISLHYALTAETKHLVDARALALMKPSAFLINTARGQLVDEQALANALNNGLLAGAGLDVLSTEPPSANNPLLTANNCIITPHIAWATIAARQRLMNSVVENVRCFINNKPINVVS